MRMAGVSVEPAAILGAVGFRGVQYAALQRPAYHPKLFRRSGSFTVLDEVLLGEQSYNTRSEHTRNCARVHWTRTPSTPRALLPFVSPFETLLAASRTRRPTNQSNLAEANPCGRSRRRISRRVSLVP